MPVRALVFDLDGLLVDTESTDFAAWERAYRDHGHALPRDLWTARIGSDGAAFEPLAHLASLVGPEFDADAMQRARRAHRDALMRALGPRPGAVRLVEAARERGLRRAVASSSERAWVEGHLARIGLRAHFEVLCCKEDVPRVKPDPALYLAALRALGVAPEEAVAFEDSPSGAAAAAAAGLYCVVVPNPMTRSLAFEGAHLELASLEHASLDEILERAAGR